MISPTETYQAPQALAIVDPGVSWTAVFAGATAAMATSTLLILLGLGLGFTTTSSWSDPQQSAEGLGLSSIVWLILTQIVASVLGGYMAARLRRRRVELNDGETRFRDTSHGFLAWAVATLLTMTLIVGSAASLIGAGIQAGSQMASGAMSSAGNMLGNFIDQDASNLADSLLNTEQTPMAGEPPQAAVLRIINRTLANDGQLSAQDRRYLVQLVAQRSGISQADAERRVDELQAQARKTLQDAQNTARRTADQATKIAAWGSLWTFITLLCGAIFASLAARYAGRQRTEAQLASHPAYPDVN